MTALTPPRVRWSRWWDQASIYLPVLIMGGLALGSYWILRSTPQTSEPPPERPVVHKPDYFMRGMTVRTFDIRGQIQSEVFGQEVRHYPDTDTLELDQARIRTTGSDGLLTTAQAQRISTNGPQTEFFLQGQVSVVRDGALNTKGQPRPPMTFHGERLRIHTGEKWIAAEQPVEMLRGADRITADTLHYDDHTRIAHWRGRVRATLAPR